MHEPTIDASWPTEVCSAPGILPVLSFPMAASSNDRLRNIRRYISLAVSLEMSMASLLPSAHWPNARRRASPRSRTNRWARRNTANSPYANTDGNRLQYRPGGTLIAGEEAELDTPVCDEARGPGRPRDPDLESRVFAAALKIYAEAGWSGFSFEAVARTA